MTGPSLHPDKQKEARRSLIEFLFSQTAEKLIYLEAFLKDAELKAPGRRPNLIESFYLFLASQWEELKERVTGFAKLSDCELSAIDEQTFFAGLIRLARNIRESHRALRWVATPWVELETYTFLDGLFQDARSKEADKKIKEVYRKINGTVVFTDEYKFETYEPYKDVREWRLLGRSPALGLPKIERSNPLMWAILVHEVCHALSHDFAIDAHVYERLKDNVPQGEAAVLQNWAKELAADLLSLELLGPAYLFSMLTYAIAFIPENLHKPSSGHPAVVTRIDALHNLLERRGMYRDVPDIRKPAGFLILYDRRCELDQEMRNLYHEDPGESRLEQPVVDAILKETESQIREIDFPLPQFCSDNLTKAELLASSLMNRTLISSAVTADALLECRRLFGRGQLTRETFQRVQGLRDDSPNLTSEIINAGWIAKAQIQCDAIGDFIYGAGSFDERRQALRKSIGYFDTLLQKSIETALIHDFYRRRMVSLDQTE